MLFWPILGHFWCPVLTLVTGCPSVPNLGTDGHACLSVPILGTNTQISKNLKKKQFKKIFFLFCQKKLNKIAFPLVLPNEEISLRPELSSSPRFRFQGGYRERDEQRTNKGRKSSCLILDVTNP